MIRIDGSFGEGGGQILRTALGLSLVTGEPFRIEGIRAKRKKPGLLRQHLTGVEAAAAISGAKVEGAALGATSLTFTPGQVKPGEYSFKIGTAGSATLVFQTVLPALMTASGPSRLTIEGGTHNEAAPPFDFIAKTFLPLLARMGPRVTARLERYGFYPAGGGRLVFDIAPAPLRPLVLGERGATTSRRAVAIVANLPKRIGDKETQTAVNLLGWSDECRAVVETRESPGPGNVVMVEVGSGEVTELFTAFGAMGITAAAVADQAARAAREYLASQAVAGEHLTDQLLLPLALARGCEFTALKLSLHTRTNMSVIRQFVPVEFATEERERYVLVTARSA